MNQIQPFTFPTTGQTVRTVVIDDEPWFVASDVTAILGYRMASDATRWLDEDEKGTHLVRTPGGEQLASIVSEPGLYVLILRSNAIGAREFKRWVTHEVLSAIRKTGSYGAPVIPTLPEALRNWAAEIEARTQAENRALAAEHQVFELAPAAFSWEVLNDTGGDMDFAQGAQVLNRDPNISMGRNRLFAYTDSIGWTYKHGKLPRRPYQAQVDLGRLTLRMPKSFTNGKTQQEELADSQIGITPKGLAELHRLLGGTADFRSLVADGVAA